MKEKDIPFWPSRANTGNYVSIRLTEEHIEYLKTCVGKKLLFKILKEESIATDRSPSCYLEEMNESR